MPEFPLNYNPEGPRGQTKESLTKEIEQYLKAQFPIGNEERPMVDHFYDSHKYYSGRNPSSQTAYLREKLMQLHRDANAWGLANDYPTHHVPTHLEALRKFQQDILERDPHQPAVLTLEERLTVLRLAALKEVHWESNFFNTLSQNALTTPGSDSNNPELNPYLSPEISEGISAMVYSQYPKIHKMIEIVWHLDNYATRLTVLSRQEED